MLIELAKIMGLSVLYFFVVRLTFEVIDPSYASTFSLKDAEVSILLLYVAYLMGKRKGGDA